MKLLTLVLIVISGLASAGPPQEQKGAPDPNTSSRATQESDSSLQRSVFDRAANQFNLEFSFGESESQSAKPRRAARLQILVTPALVVKDGAVYITLAGGVAMPMAGGGASGCVPGSPLKWKDVVK